MLGDGRRGNARSALRLDRRRVGEQTDRTGVGLGTRFVLMCRDLELPAEEQRDQRQDGEQARASTRERVCELDEPSDHVRRRG